MSIQPDFLQQKCEIEEKSTASPNGAYHKVIYYPKFHCELNHIEHFWCNGKDYARMKCDYTNIISPSLSDGPRPSMPSQGREQWAARLQR